MGLINSIMYCCEGVCARGIAIVDDESRPLIIEQAQEAIVIEQAEERRQRAALRSAQQLLLFQRLQLPELHEERRRLQGEELRALQARWRDAVAAGEARRPRGLY